MQEFADLQHVPWWLKIFIYFGIWGFKFFAVIVGVIIALSMSGDIKPDGTVKISRGLIVRFTSGAISSLYMGQSVIELIDPKMSLSHQGTVMLLVAVFSWLALGIVYQCIAMMRGKTLSEVTSEVTAVIKAIIMGIK